MFVFAALIAFVSSIAFVALCGGGKKDNAPKTGAPVVQKNDIAPTEAGECPKDTVADVKSSWGGDGGPEKKKEEGK
ncbi:hypothetical protein PRIPAC_89998 [Pristionchus pacificus]|uniref:Uncharacterized protein n=1 Tax=Pristionchus pacificus TaxID=54126 RepID=A0A2A6CIQ6_PRIPA|nr:hypothetical protein PRIPAC_89998 [Pristionchus pacificus]|eukprot:PDM78114.1 hypothetical protein PRIPAC_30499 [Pristionchus pacificus]